MKLIRKIYYYLINLINKYLFFIGHCLIKVKKFDKKLLNQNYQDYYRTIYIISNLNLISKAQSENEKKGKKAAIAELGVYNGRTAKLLNKIEIDRRLYLFDTFEGFNNKDLTIEKNSQYSSGKMEFQDANYKALRNYFSNKDNVIFIKGYFPMSIEDKVINDKFIFVIIDFDLYKPTLDGLRYFWDKMLDGGIIMVHDFDSLKFKGITDAVNQFSREQNVNFTCLPCAGGSAIFQKNKKI